MDAMRLIIVLSLLINVAALLPVCAGLLSHASWTTSAYGEGTQERWAAADQECLTHPCRSAGYGRL